MGELAARLMQDKSITNAVLEQTSGPFGISQCLMENPLGTQKCENVKQGFIMLYTVADEEATCFLPGNRIRKQKQVGKTHAAEGATEECSDALGI